MNSRGKKLVAFISVLTLLLSGSVAVANAAVEQGAICTKANAVSTVNGTSFTCLKSGSKYTWKKVVVADTNKLSAPPTSFSDLVTNRKGISQLAWIKAKESIAKNVTKLGTFEIYTGPKTKPYFNEYQKAAALVSKLFPTIKEPVSNIVVQYVFKDLAWADAKVKELLPTSEIERLNRSEGGRLLTSNCESTQKTCNGSKQLTTSDGVSLVLQGVPTKFNPYDLAGKDRFYSGMLEAHEYFHSLQRIPTQGIGIQQKDFPPVWFVEGSAEWVQNATINNGNFNKYKNFFDLNCQKTCKKLTKSDITKILTEATNSYWPKQYEYFLNYAWGSMIIESLVSITNPESIMRMYDEFATKIGFEAAFKNVYGIEWSAAIPILTEAVYLNLQGRQTIY